MPQVYMNPQARMIDDLSDVRLRNGLEIFELFREKIAVLDWEVSNLFELMQQADDLYV
jgi:hypothetical protein